MSSTHTIRTCLWFAKGGLDAARRYVELIPNSVLETPVPAEGAPEPLIVLFHLNGVPFSILNGGPHYTLSPAASIVVSTPDQAETDRLWDALCEGGAPSRCGWLVDRFGVSWQIVPEVLPRLLGADDRAAAGRAMQALLQMGKLDTAVLEAAFRGEGAGAGG
jgi:predicted 3-demethylubiquinone-9 3-methyltransferase (glyoxalase superfamily)